MTTPRWFFDFISPFSYLQWAKLSAHGGAQRVQAVPILFGAVLDALGTRGPAEIPRKREFTYRHVLWRARQEGIPLRFPPAHPFNPLPALRLCIAAGSTDTAISAIFDWLWAQGRAGDSGEALAPLAAQLDVATDAADSDAVKSMLRANTDAALAAGVFGVPTLAIGGDLFWGNDAHDFMLAVLDDAAVLEDPDMRALASLPVGIRRR